ncbi:MAG: nucleotide exchange factor GrpE [Lachnospiraceae bacterium]|nr:nucleotide exchange factor GrpE [Lachnospiraceae bacterium]
MDILINDKNNMEEEISEREEIVEIVEEIKLNNEIDAEIEESDPVSVANSNEGEVKAVDYSESFDEIKNEIILLQKLFEKRLLIDEQKNQIIANQGEELQKYKDGLYEKIFKPLLVDIVEIADDLHRMIRVYENKEEDNVPISKFISILNIYESDIEDILEKYGVKVFCTEENDFNPKCQKIVKLIETSEPELGHKVADRILKGFDMDGKIIKPERVNVYKYNADSVNNEEVAESIALEKNENK